MHCLQFYRFYGDVQIIVYALIRAATSASRVPPATPGRGRSEARPDPARRRRARPRGGGEAVSAWRRLAPDARRPRLRPRDRGTSIGTDPLRALLQKERQRRR